MYTAFRGFFPMLQYDLNVPLYLPSLVYNLQNTPIPVTIKPVENAR
jgi:hypothetical protein